MPKDIIWKITIERWDQNAPEDKITYKSEAFSQFEIERTSSPITGVLNMLKAKAQAIYYEIRGNAPR